MQTFATARDAKEFLVSRIIAESQRAPVPLSEVERKMLYFSETGWTLPDMEEVDEAFERECNEAEYEQKIGRLIRNLCANARANDREEFDAWTEAVRTLSHEDHYLLVLIGKVEESFSVRRFLKLLGIALAGAGVVFVIAFWVVSR